MDIGDSDADPARTNAMCQISVTVQYRMRM